jgi:hypothetical protein
MVFHVCRAHKNRGLSDGYVARIAAEIEPMRLVHRGNEIDRLVR